MNTILIMGADVIAILLLVAAYYYRHHRRDMLLAYIGLNIGVLIVATVLTTVSIGLGVGLGLFGVLSIIRLRSSVISQEEVAYFFASLALGLVNGLAPSPLWVAPALSAFLVLTIAIVDHPKLHTGFRRQVVTLDSVVPNEAQLISELEKLLGATVKRVVTTDTDLVRDQMTVDVSYRLNPVPTPSDEAATPTKAGRQSDTRSMRTESPGPAQTPPVRRGETPVPQPVAAGSAGPVPPVPRPIRTDGA